MDSLITRRELLPPEAPLDMPVHPLARQPEPTPPLHNIRIGLRRWLVFGTTAVLSAFAILEMWEVLDRARWTALGVVLTALFGTLFVWIALSFTSALAGFLVMLHQRRPAPPAAAPTGRTALLMPIYNEPVPRMEAALTAMRASLAEAGVEHLFDIFVLSDTRDDEARDNEWAAARRLGAQPGAHVFYRCRDVNTHRKAGNIAEWVRRFGGAYGQFLILDADSLMEARTLVAMAARMEAEPRLGLLQTLPMLHGGRTLFARLQQFAGHVYGPTLAHGLAWWSGAEGNYWGHNAMIRTEAFAAAAGLPELPGRKPFGGQILSHDFVEAALLRRAGWQVVFDPNLVGSWEEGPPTLPDLCVRDRRWCQGNMQHAAVISAPGLHPVSRLHMAQGIFAYVSAPLWLGFLLIALLVGVQARFTRPEYFPATPVLFPQWPVIDAERALWVFAGTMALLLAPKVMGAVAYALSAHGPRRLGGGLRLLGGLLFEILLSALLSPITMVTQIRHLFGILRGRDGGWEPQRRDAGAWAWREGFRFTRVHLALGVVLFVTAYAMEPAVAAWMSPVLAGLLLSPLLVGWTSSEAGRLARGLLETPPEAAPTPILRLAETASLQPARAAGVDPVVTSKERTP
jgi:membrane glycosyltransferase